MNTRESIYAALYALTAPLQTAGTLKTRSRVWLHWTEVSHEYQPAFFQVQKTEEFVEVKGRPALRKLTVDWIVYVNRGNNPEIVPSTELNGILDALEMALMPVEGMTQTLGGLASHAWIAGAIETDEGTLGPQAVAVIPIEILAPRDYSGPCAE